MADRIAEEHRVLGFDARVSPTQLAGLWPAQRKEEWLLRSDVEFPLSIDDMVPVSGSTANTGVSAKFASLSTA